MNAIVEESCRVLSGIISDCTSIDSDSLAEHYERTMSQSLYQRTGMRLMEFVAKHMHGLLSHRMEEGRRMFRLREDAFVAEGVHAEDRDKEDWRSEHEYDETKKRFWPGTSNVPYAVGETVLAILRDNAAVQPNGITKLCEFGSLYVNRTGRKIAVDAGISTKSVLQEMSDDVEMLSDETAVRARVAGGENASSVNHAIIERINTDTPPSAVSFVPTSPAVSFVPTFPEVSFVPTFPAVSFVPRISDPVQSATSAAASSVSTPVQAATSDSAVADNKEDRGRVVAAPCDVQFRGSSTKVDTLCVCERVIGHLRAAGLQESVVNSAAHGDKLYPPLVIGIKCKGYGSGLHGRVDLIQVVAPSGHVFVFDVLKEPKMIPRGGLGDLLEDQKTVKVMRDCYRDIASLFSSFGTRMTTVFDLQVADELLRSKPDFVSHRPESPDVVLRVRDMLRRNASLWSMRPLPAEAIASLSTDVADLTSAMYWRYREVMSKLCSGMECDEFYDRCTLLSSWAWAPSAELIALHDNANDDILPQWLCFDARHNAVTFDDFRPKTYHKHVSRKQAVARLVEANKADLETLLSILPEVLSAPIRDLLDEHLDARLERIEMDIGACPVGVFKVKWRARRDEYDSRRSPNTRYTEDGDRGEHASPKMVADAFRHMRVRLSDAVMVDRDVHSLIEMLGWAQNVATYRHTGVEGTLHHVSFVAGHYQGTFSGVTVRAGFSVPGACELIEDLVWSGDTSMMIVGRKSAGKTIFLREMARVIADERGDSVMIVDTRGEIGGKSLKTHSSVGQARRMIVPTDIAQASVIREAVEHHLPDVLVIGEVCNRDDVCAVVAAISQGVRVIIGLSATSLLDVVRNKDLCALAGLKSPVCVDGVTNRGVSWDPQSRSERPMFSFSGIDACVELKNTSHCVVFSSVQDTILKHTDGKPVQCEERFVACANADSRACGIMARQMNVLLLNATPC